MACLQIQISAQAEKEEIKNLHSLFKQISDFDRSESLSRGLSRGEHPLKVSFRSEDDYEKKLKSYQDFHSQLQVFDPDHLTDQDRISTETMALKLTGEIDQLSFKSYLIPFNAEGGFFNSLSSSIKRLPFNTVADFESYLIWLPTYPDYLNAHIALMRQGIAQGIIAPKVIVANTMKQVEPWRNRDYRGHSLTQMLLEKPSNIESKEWDEIVKNVLSVMTEKIWPAYDRLYNFLKDEYFPKAYDAPGVSNIPNGWSYYESRIAYFTTKDMSPEEVYDTGLKEVERIKTEMEGIIEEVGFEGSFSSFLDFLRTDEQFYAKTPQELLSYAAWLSKKAEGQLPKLFSHLYKLPFTVEPVPDDIAPTYTGGRYVPGSRNQDRPGIYWVNTYNLPARSLYNLPALTVHEAVPGHHLQIMISAELEDLPTFRNRFYISAFGEGWGLYSEYLGEEMGMYATPYDRFGRYTYEMWRACRLVVDVGLHVKGWTRAEAVNFLASNTALSLHEVNTEIDRYIGWPGQAVSYKIGEITIKNLRGRAEEMLEEKFDIKEFHYRILRNGSIPLPSLEREIENWIKEKMSTE